ncbi:MAG: hypothetical protein QXZ17_12820 [Nitrososphaerota archaeon]
MNNEQIIQKQIYFLRYLSSKYDSNIQVSLTGKSKWLNLYDVIRNPPNFPIASRSILKNELVLEIDNDDWSIVRDGSRKILELLERWEARNSYYLAFSGHNSIHVHTFLDVSGIEIKPDVQEILEGIDKDEIRKMIKSYIMRQISIGADVNLDMNLSGKHLIRLEGSTHEITNKPCSMIDSIPDDRPESYEIKIPGPDSLPPKLWDISFMEAEINSFFKIYFAEKKKVVHYGPGKPISVNPEQLVSALKPIYIRGYRHFVILSISGFLKRHQVPLNIAQKVVEGLTVKDEEKASRLYSLREVYRSSLDKKIPGLPHLLEIIKTEAREGKISEETERTSISELKSIVSKNMLKTVYILQDFKIQWHNRVLDLRKEDLLNIDEKLAMHLQSIGVAKILDKEVQT